jgi:hypothetical protein
LSSDKEDDKYNGNPEAELIALQVYNGEASSGDSIPAGGKNIPYVLLSLASNI